MVRYNGKTVVADTEANLFASELAFAINTIAYCADSEKHYRFNGTIWILEQASTGGSIDIVQVDPSSPANNKIWILQTIDNQSVLQAMVGGFPMTSTPIPTTRMDLKVKSDTGQIFSTQII